MITFEERNGKILLVYLPEQGDVAWLDKKLESDGEYTLAFTFSVRLNDVVPVEDEDLDEDTRRFTIGSIQGDYQSIRSDVLGTKHDVLIGTEIRLQRKVFIAERNISIFWRIDELSHEQIIVGGDRPGAIPAVEFKRLLAEFPNSGEMRLFSYARVTRVLREYMQTMSDAEKKLAEHYERRARQRAQNASIEQVRLPAANALEIEKFSFVRDRLAEMLNEAESYDEATWQRTVADLFLLLFPQYVAVLQKVRIKESYSRTDKITNRELDMALVSANGTMDVLEIKKPFSHGLMSTGKYRDNHVPLRELSGTVMQVEKYLFYLSKLGRDGEKSVTDAHRSQLPEGLEIRITNPKAFILSGRDGNSNSQQNFDFEFVRRKYSNVVDIITYDDLLRRLDNILAALRDRTDRPSPLVETASGVAQATIPADGVDDTSTLPDEHHPLAQEPS